MIKLPFFMTNYAGLIIEREDGKCLFQLRNKKDKDFPSKWGLFGGHSRKNENPLTTIIREVKEEINYSLDKSRLRKVFSFCFPLVNITIYYTKISHNHKKMSLIDGEKMKYFYPSEMIFNKNSMFLLRILMAYFIFSSYSLE